MDETLAGEVEPGPHVTIRAHHPLRLAERVCEKERERERMREGEKERERERDTFELNWEEKYVIISKSRAALIS